MRTIRNLELTAGEMGEDIISIVQYFGVFLEDNPAYYAELSA
jgi:hypothetical protein